MCDFDPSGKVPSCCPITTKIGIQVDLIDPTTITKRHYSSICGLSVIALQKSVFCGRNCRHLYLYIIWIDDFFVNHFEREPNEIGPFATTGFQDMTPVNVLEGLKKFVTFYEGRGRATPIFT